MFFRHPEGAAKRRTASRLQPTRALNILIPGKPRIMGDGTDLGFTRDRQTCIAQIG
jgi:hypothetical protein